MHRYLIYQITNKINKFTYIGSHKTKNMEDGYFGSGKYLRRAIKKYGIGNFYKEILFEFDNEKDMFTKEAELVNEEFVSRADTYNLNIGGDGGFSYINQNKFGVQPGNTHIKIAWEKDREKMLAGTRKGAATILNEQKGIFSKEFKTKYPKSGFYGKKHSEETKEKIRQSRKNRVK